MGMMSPAARLLLQLASCFAPDDKPVEIVEMASKILEKEDGGIAEMASKILGKGDVAGIENDFKGEQLTSWVNFQHILS